MRRSALALSLAGVVGLGSLLGMARPEPGPQPGGHRMLMVSSTRFVTPFTCAFTPGSATIDITIPETATFTDNGQCGSVAITIVGPTGGSGNHGPNATAGFDVTCALKATSGSSFTVYGCNSWGFYTVTVKVSGVTVQTISVHAVV